MKALLVTLVAACGAAPPEPTPIASTPAKPAARRYHIPTRSEDVSVAVDGDGVTINGARLSATPTVDDVEKLLGPADRAEDLPANILHTWDRLGVIVYEPHDGRAQTIGFVYTSGGISYHPKTAFAGRTRIDGQPPALAEQLRFGSIEVYVGNSGGDAVHVVEISFYNGESSDEGDGEAPVIRSPALRAAVEACGHGDAKQCTAAAVLYERRADHGRANAYAERACDRDDAFGCVTLAVLYDTGRGVAVSHDRAVRLYAKACRLGATVACNMSP